MNEKKESLTGCSVNGPGEGEAPAREPAGLAFPCITFLTCPSTAFKLIHIGSNQSMD